MALYLFLAPLLLMAKSSAQPNFISHFCINNAGNFTANSTFKTNLDNVLSSITTNPKLNYGFYRFSYGQTTDIAKASGVCRPNIGLEVCRSCLNDSVRLLAKLCPNQKEAIGLYENCSLHYSSRSTSRIRSTKNATNSDQFIRRLRILYDRPSLPLMTISTASETGNKTRVAQGKKKNVKTRVHIVIIMVLLVLSCWILIICIYLFLRSKRIEHRVETH